MDIVTFGLYLVGGLAVVVGLLYLAKRYKEGRADANRTWVERSGGDRREQSLPVDFDRRVSPRRQEDIARSASKYLGDKG